MGRCGAMNAPPGSSSPVSSKITTPLQSRLQPCSGWLAMVCAASRSGAEGAGQGGVCGHISVHLAVHSACFRLVLACSSCCDKTFSVNPGGGLAEMANPGKAHHQGRSHPLLHGEPVGLFRGLAGGRGRWWSQRGGPERRVSSCRAGCGSVLMTCGRCAGLRRGGRRGRACPRARAEDFVIAVSEIAANAVRYGSPTARLLLLWVAGGAAQAEVRDSGCWRPAAGAVSGDGRSGGMRPCAGAPCLRWGRESGPGRGAPR